MSIKHVAAAVITPAALAGIALSTGATASAAPAHRAAGNAPRQDRQQPRQDRDPRYQWVTVQPGETLSGIAAAHRISWQALFATPPNYHQIADPNVITAGQRLRLPKNPRLRAAQFPRLAAKLQAQAPDQQAQSDPASAPAAQPTESQPASDQPAQASAPSVGASGSSLTSGMSAFERCVAFRESSDNPTAPDGLFGILPSTWASLGYSGTAGQAPVSVQEQAFNRLYAADGTAPWAPYDGC